VEEQEITLATLDGWVTQQQIYRIDFIKIDTDGMEMKVLRGAQETLRRFRPVVIFELIPQDITDAGDSAEALVQLLQELKYRLLHEGSLQPWRDYEEAINSTKRGACVNVVAWPIERPLQAAT